MYTSINYDWLHKIDDPSVAIFSSIHRLNRRKSAKAFEDLSTGVFSTVRNKTTTIMHCDSDNILICPVPCKHMKNKDRTVHAVPL